MKLELKNYNIKGSMLILQKDYLKDRSQSTVINNVVSEHEIDCGLFSLKNEKIP